MLVLSVTLLSIAEGWSLHYAVCQRNHTNALEKELFLRNSEEKFLTKLSMVTIRWRQMWKSSYSLETISLIVDEGASLLTTSYLLENKSQNSKPLLVTGPARWKQNPLILKEIKTGCISIMIFYIFIFAPHLLEIFGNGTLLPALPDSRKTNYVKIVEARGEKTR